MKKAVVLCSLVAFALLGVSLVFAQAPAIENERLLKRRPSKTNST